MRILNGARTLTMTWEECFSRYRLLYQILNDSRRPIATTGAYRLAKLFKAMQEEGQKIEEAHNALIKELGAKVEGQDVWKVAPEHEATFQERVKPMMEQTVTLSLKPIPLRLLGEQGGMTAAEFLVLGDLISEDGVVSNGQLSRA